MASLTALALVLVVAVSAEAQLPKQGTFTGKFGWWAVGKVYEMEKGHIYWEGEFNGTLFNDAGEGLLHGTSWVCPGYNELRDGISMESGGRCIVTDMDGDKVFTVWHGGKGTMPLKFNGDNQFVGGTGKYTGIRGNHTYRVILCRQRSRGLDFSPASGGCPDRFAAGKAGPDHGRRAALDARGVSGLVRVWPVGERS